MSQTQTQTIPQTTPIDQAKLEAFLGQVVGDAGAAMSAALVVLGDRLGLYKALARGPATAADLARRTGTGERYVQEWLDAQASGGYVHYARDAQTYELRPEQAVALADELSPAFVPGMFQIMQAMWSAVDRMAEKFKTGDGLSWAVRRGAAAATVRTQGRLLAARRHRRPPERSPRSRTPRALRPAPQIGSSNGGGGGGAGRIRLTAAASGVFVSGTVSPSVADGLLTIVTLAP